MNTTSILYAVAALGGMGVFLGLMLGIAGKAFAVEVDERVALVREKVAGANCGACGYPGCDAFAVAVVKGEAPVTGCTPGGVKCAEALAEIMGVSSGDLKPMIARIRCLGGCGVSADRYTYEGLKSCRHAAGLAGGPKVCSSACYGLGDCERVCQFDAISFVNGLCVIDPEKCTACGMCVSQCPNNLIKLLPQAATVTVRCRNTQPPRVANSACTFACIACKRCEKACEYDAIHVNNFLAEIDPDKCTLCGACVEVCPKKCITISA